MCWPVFFKGCAENMVARIESRPVSLTRINPLPIQVRAELAHLVSFFNFLITI